MKIMNVGFQKKLDFENKPEWSMKKRKNETMLYHIEFRSSPESDCSAVSRKKRKISTAELSSLVSNFIFQVFSHLRIEF